MGGDDDADKLRFALEQETITRERVRRTEAWFAARHFIMRFIAPGPALAAPEVANIAAAEQFELSPESLEAGRAVLKEPSTTVVERNRGHALRRHKLKSVLVGAMVVCGWFVWL